MRHRDQTDMGGSQENFLTTHWSLIDDVAMDRDKDQALIALLIQRYWKPVYCYLRRKGCSNEEAKDLTQSFFHEIVLNRRLLERADHSRGRFRTFLLHALDQFLIDHKRKETARKRIPLEKLVSLDVGNLAELPEAALSVSPTHGRLRSSTRLSLRSARPARSRVWGPIGACSRKEFFSPFITVPSRPPCVRSASAMALRANPPPPTCW